MQDIHHILKTYWGYDQFRPLQEDIIQSVLAGKDTLALLPTGGGKSICFQVPALVKDGICLVVTPLIALMKDQVEQLKKREINAVAIFSGMNRREIDIALDNCVYGNVKFLYLSPERLQSEIFQERVKRMKVNLLAIDEAHCISQWGYDFRPSYLQISQLREQLPNVPVLALTATATGQVRQDIEAKLSFKESNVFVKSFARANLSYSCLYTEDKVGRLLQVLQRMQGQSIVYVRSRRQTTEIVRFLQQKRISAAAYHAGLKFEERNLVQNAWVQNSVRVIVATNAFGMGIDKPDVRLVVHLDLPESLEAYYQEAGRAGRDEKYAYAVILYGPNDVQELEQKVTEAHPPIEVIRRVYQCLANYFQLAVGSGTLSSFDFDIADFSRQYKLSLIETHHALKRLEAEGYLQLNEGYYVPSRLLLTLTHTALYEFQVMNPEFDNLLRMILRYYGGEAFSNFVKITEKKLAQQLNKTEQEIRQKLQYLHKVQVLVYEPQHDAPQLTFTMPRQDAQNLPLNKNKLKELRERAQQKSREMGRYVKTEDRCRTQMLLEYFSEINDTSCRICDYCLAERKRAREGKEDELLQKKTIDLLQSKALLPVELVNRFEPKHQETVTRLVREMLDVGKLYYLESGKLALGKAS